VVVAPDEASQLDRVDVVLKSVLFRGAEGLLVKSVIQTLGLLLERHIVVFLIIGREKVKFQKFFLRTDEVLLSELYVFEIYLSHLFTYFIFLFLLLKHIGEIKPGNMLLANPRLHFFQSVSTPNSLLASCCPTSATVITEYLCQISHFRLIKELSILGRGLAALPYESIVIFREIAVNRITFKPRGHSDCFCLKWSVFFLFA
jgi:hypothetical protein